MSHYKSVDPAFVDDTNVQTQPAPYASYPLLTPGHVAYLPVCRGMGQDLHESAVFHYAFGDVAATTAMTKGSPFMRTSPEAESRAMGIIKNLPSRCGEDAVLNFISKLGFGSDVTSFSMPTRIGRGNRKLNKGYAFAYFSDERICRDFVEAADGYRGFGEHPSGRAISAIFSLHFGGRPWGTSSAGSPQETEDELTEASCQ